MDRVTKLRWSLAGLLFSIGQGISIASDCTGVITTIPVIIDAPGTYCVTSYLTTALADGAAIEIQSDDVTIDMSAGGGLDNLAVGPNTTAMGIHADDRNR